MGCDVADHSVSDASRNGPGGAGAGQRYSQEVSEELRVFGVHAFQQLFHDHDLSNAVTLPRIQLDMGPTGRDRIVCRTGVAAVAFWAEAIAQVRIASWLALPEGFGRISQMPRRELKEPRQVEDWLIEMNQQLTQSAEMILIGSGGLLWHAFSVVFRSRCRRIAWMLTR
jgi:hypothetical protein